MSIDTTFLRSHIASLEAALQGVGRHGDDDVRRDLYRAACVKEFELVLEQSGKLLRKRLSPWFASNRQADRLHFKDLFRHAAKHGLMDCDAVERWLRCRDNRAFPQRDLEEEFLTGTMALLPEFVEDAKALAAVIEGAGDG